MSRSVVLAGTDRCGGCRIPPRWCVCEALPLARSPVAVTVFIHRREWWRPTSTGHLIARAYQDATAVLLDRALSPPDAPGLDPRRDWWILHPRGDVVTASEARAQDPTRLGLVLLDGSWQESIRMLERVSTQGRRVRLIASTPSRFWLRAQHETGNVSTIEALLLALELLGLDDARARLELHFELHVYAMLRARGKTDLAAAYLAASPLAGLQLDILDRLHTRRPNVDSLERGSANV